MENRQARRRLQFALGSKPRSQINDVVSLPLAGWQAGIDQRRILAINGAGRTIGVSLVSERIEHLRFIAIQSEENATVAAPLAFTLRRRRSGPFKVQLAIAEALARADVAAAFDAFHIA